MDDLKSLLSGPKAQVLVLGGALILLGATAWGIGWTAHSLFGRLAAPPEKTPEPTPPAPTMENIPTTSPTPPPESATVPATSTALPTVEDSVEAIIVKASDRGAYDVVRRACDLPRNYVLSPDNEIVQETWQLNGFVGERPTIFEGQEIQVPIYLCP